MIKVITGLKIKLAEPKRPKKPNSPKRVSNRLHLGTCFRDTDGAFKAHVMYEEALRVLPFTDDSYSLKGKEVVFSHNKDSKGRVQMFIRREREYKYTPGLDTQYTPFCENYVYNGYIVKYNGKLYFKMNKLVGHYNEVFNQKL